MPRQPRIEYPDAIYHVMARGDRNEPIFLDDEDREMFLRTMDEAVERSGWKVYGWVLMTNHYHWSIQTPEPNLVAGMKWFQNTYTRRFNTRHGAWGHLFGGRYKAIPVEEADRPTGGEGSYLAALLDYIHLNPARAGLVSRGKRMALADYPWSSLSQGYAVPPESRRPGMAAREGLELFGFADEEKDRLAFVRRAEERTGAEGESAGMPASAGKNRQGIAERGWYVGGDAFRQKLLSLANQTAGNRNYKGSSLGREQDRLGAQAWLDKGKKHFGIKLPAEGRQHQAERVAIAWALHRKTNQPQGWIAEALGLRTAANVSQQVRRFERDVDEGTKPAKGEALLSGWIDLVRKG
ncbi:MAG TPA: transposase [Chthoniobacteraceae bacterium]|nr:transposase [Chthoniobacteraceae bacterium]